MNTFVRVRVRVSKRHVRRDIEGTQVDEELCAESLTSGQSTRKNIERVLIIWMMLMINS